MKASPNNYKRIKRYKKDNPIKRHNPTKWIKLTRRKRVLTPFGRRTQISHCR